MFQPFGLKTRRNRMCELAVTILFAAAAVATDAGATAYRGARIYTVAGALIERGVVVVENGKIVAGWDNWDQFTMLREIGAIGEPGVALTADAS